MAPGQPGGERKAAFFMAKKNMGKVKRYRRSFYSGRQRAMRVLAAVGGIVLLFALGWFAGPALVQLGSNAWHSLATEPSETSTPNSQTGTSQPEQPGSQPEQTEPSAQPTEQPGEDLTQGSWAFVDSSQLADPAALASELASQGVGYAVVTLKDAAGNVYYNSGVETAAAGLVQGGFDAAAVAQALQQQGIVPVAGICAFRDPIAAGANRAMAVMYQDTEYLWLDAALESGGKPWLNPYSQLAVQYITDLMNEARSMGYQKIWLSGVQFPTPAGRSQANYGATNGVSEQQRLAALIDQWQQQDDCWIVYPLEVASGANETLTGGPVAQLGIHKLAVQASQSLTEEENAQLEAAKGAASQYLGVQSGQTFTVQAVQG